jgi:hypothetical protein
MTSFASAIIKKKLSHLEQNKVRRRKYKKEGEKEIDLNRS